MTAQEILKKIIDEHGGYVLFSEENKIRLSGMISDYFPDDRKMRKMLRFAVNENIACRLLKVKDTGDASIEIKKLKYYLHDECGLDERFASQVVDCFAFALGLHSQNTKSEMLLKRDGTIRKDAAPKQGYDSDANENTVFEISPTIGRKTAHHPAEPEMVFVQGGTFMMGATPEQGNDCDDNEKLAHRVTVSDFYIGKYEVTQAEWKTVMGNNPSHFLGKTLPVESISWDDVQVFIRKLNTLTGKRYRLPTEAEWEFAARGGNRSKGYKYSGSNILGDVAWNEDNSSKKTHVVGAKSPNELGIYDMSGNVWEWCNDWYGKYNSNAGTNPQGPISGAFRVYRGGSWIFSARNTRVSTRNCNRPGYLSFNLGFRLACTSK